MENPRNSSEMARSYIDLKIYHFRGKETSRHIPVEKLLLVSQNPKETRKVLKQSSNNSGISINPFLSVHNSRKPIDVITAEEKTFYKCLSVRLKNSELSDVVMLLQGPSLYRDAPNIGEFHSVSHRW